MARDIEYDDSNLMKLFAELSPKNRARAIKGALRRAANKVRKAAISKLRSSIHSNKQLERGVRAIVFRGKIGFRVTVGSKNTKKRGKQESRSKKEKSKDHILIWAEDGTKERKTRSESQIFKRRRAGHNTGRMKRYGFMDSTQKEVSDSVTSDLHNEIINSIQKTAKKYGCT